MSLNFTWLYFNSCTNMEHNSEAAIHQTNHRETKHSVVNTHRGVAKN